MAAWTKTYDGAEPVRINKWLALEGVPTVSDDPDRVAEAVRRYGSRYRVPGVNPARVVNEIAVDRVLGRG